MSERKSFFRRFRSIFRKEAKQTVRSAAKSAIVEEFSPNLSNITARYQRQHIETLIALLRDDFTMPDTAIYELINYIVSCQMIKHEDDAAMLLLLDSIKSTINHMINQEIDLEIAEKMK